MSRQPLPIHRRPSVPPAGPQPSGAVSPDAKSSIIAFPGRAPQRAGAATDRSEVAGTRRLPSPGTGAGRRGLATMLLSAVARFLRIRRNRRATIALLDFDTERLTDIGLTRADVRAALFDPASPDPTGLLEALAAERRGPRARPSRAPKAVLD